MAAPKYKTINTVDENGVTRVFDVIDLGGVGFGPNLIASDTSYTGVSATPVAEGAAIAATAIGRALQVNCTAAGAVVIGFIDGTSLTIAVDVGTAIFPYVISKIIASGSPRSSRPERLQRLLNKPLGLNPFKVNPGSYLAIIGAKTQATMKPLAFDKAYTGGMLTTKFSFSQLFGYFEIKANLPVGKGMWPAFWLLPTYGQWPANGEIDIFEGLGAANEIWCSVHSGSAGHDEKKVTLPFLVGGSGQGWHTYGAAWTADEIVWYVDRKEVRRTKTPADMKTVPMYLLVNLAVGGSWPGMPNATTRLPANFMINRITVWRLPN